MKKRLILTLLTILVLATDVGLTKATSDTLQITNLTGQTYTYTMQQLEGMPETNVSAVLTCYGNLVTSGTWGGVQLSYLLNQAGVTENVSSIHFVAADGYSVSIPIETAQSPQTLIAYEKDGQSLSEGLRLVLPGANGASWIAQITLINMNDSQVPPPAPVNPGSANDVLTNIQNNIKPQPNTPAPTVTNTSPTATSNPTSASSPISSPTITSSQPTPQTSIRQGITDDLLPITTILIVAVILLSVSVYWAATKNRAKPKI